MATKRKKKPKRKQPKPLPSWPHYKLNYLGNSSP